MLLSKRKKKRTVVFVCTGNTCRSPMAQGLLENFLEESGVKHIEVKTAGVMTIPGLLPTPEAVQVMDSVKIDVRKHRSAPLTPEMIRKADLVLGMTPFHVQFALRMAEDARDKTFLLKEYTKSDLKNYQITDPMGATLEVYKRVFREIKLAVEKLCEMDTILAPVDRPVKHEKWVPPKPQKAAAPQQPKTATGGRAKTSRAKTSKSKTASKKTATKKPAAKKTTAKKPAAKKTTAGKTVAKKATAKKPAAKKAATKKPVARKTTAKKPATKKPVARKAATKKPAKK